MRFLKPLLAFVLLILGGVGFADAQGPQYVPAYFI
jgi:hypothetical protein